MKPKFSKSQTVFAVLVGLFALVGSGCTFISSGARSAVVVLVPEDGSAAGARALEMPPREQLEALLSPHFLWFTTERSMAQWAAYVRVRPSGTPLREPELTLLEIKKNPYWSPPLDDISRRNNEVPGSITLSANNQRSEGGNGGSK